MGGIARQSEQYGVFDNTPSPERVAREVPQEVIREYTRGRSVGTGQLNPRNIQRQHFAVNTQGMDPESHAYAEPTYQNSPGGEWQGDEDGGRALRREWNPNSGYEPHAIDEMADELVGQDDESGYNWGPEPHHDPGSDPGPHPDFGGDAPLPFGSGSYSPGGGYDDYDHGPGHLGSRLGFNQPRRLTADGEAAPMATPLFTHMFVPGHQVGLSYRDRVIPGIVTQLHPDSEVGVRWNDGQYSKESPGDIHPL